ncbi:unnamed protein product [Brassicogethes aeneus]|uniref:Uncharacterized protein n=1 Tax=Brassicogethes aeneus TaxID=1431903 RepID=A0A9P0AWJ3_BRAAE|nr:unnamed protein product [Brassicogethes aeneus]
MFFNFKNVVLLLLLALCFDVGVGFTTEDMDTDIKYIKTCNRTSPISMTTMNEVLINKKLSDQESSPFKCFLHCLFTKYGWMDEEGGFLLHDIKKTLDESDVEIASLEFILYECTATKSVDKCERSFIFTQCFWKKIQEDQPVEDQMFYNIEERK